MNFTCLGNLLFLNYYPKVINLKVFQNIDQTNNYSKAVGALVCMCSFGLVKTIKFILSNLWRCYCGGFGWQSVKLWSLVCQVWGE